MLKTYLKILVITANYPPDHLGGYEIRVKDIIDGLAQRGHDIRVLTTRKTSSKGKSAEKNNYPILRKLHNRRNARFFPKEVVFDLVDTRFLTKQINTFKPDVFYLGHIYNLSKALLPYLAEQKVPIVVDEGGASLKGAWTEKGRWFRFIGDYGQQNLFIRKLKPLVIKLVRLISKGRISNKWQWPENMQIIINSQNNLEKNLQLGIPMQNAIVIHSGIDLEVFTYLPRISFEQPLQILCPGRLEARKGIMDCVDLIGALNQSGIDARLTLVGPNNSEEYQQALNENINALGISENVVILDMVSQKDLVHLYHAADICFFPSYQEVGFSRIPLEAMACGCIVISYGNEGSDEIIEKGKNGYLVKPKDYPEIIKIINLLQSSPNKYMEVSKFARRKIEQKYAINIYIDQIEDKIKLNMGFYSMPINQIPKCLLEILICPACRLPLDIHQSNGLICKNCSSQYILSESGQLDLRLKNSKKINIEFELEPQQAGNHPTPTGFFEENPHPEVLFNNSEIPHHLSKALLSYFPKAKYDDDFVLDLGCGDALHRSVCERTGFNYVGMDYSHPKAPILGDAHALPFDYESISFILSIAMFEHIRYPFVMIKEVARVLKKGGTLIGTVAFQEPFHGNSYYHHTHLGLSNLLSYGGFKIVQLAPNRGWQVFDAQARMSAWAMFPGIPRSFSRTLIGIPQVLSNVWLRILKILKPKSSNISRAFINAGSFSFVARKENR